ncbi:MAG: PLP-dependent aspartate aminotransferase family protein [Deinococcaceae bacterium]
MSHSKNSKNFKTRAVHAGYSVDAQGAHVTPIYQTSTFSYETSNRGAQLFSGEVSGHVYSRFSNPTVRALELKVADLEGMEDAVAFSSGMSAISAVCFAVLSPGDEVIYLGPLYGGTEGLFLNLLSRLGMRVTSADGPDDLSQKISLKTKMVYVETPTNPTLKITDLARVSEIAASVGAVCVADNTFATPYLSRPSEFGFHMVLHSMTKYLGGHGDAIGGIVSASTELCKPIRVEGLRHLGGCLGPQEAYLFLRGIKTLPLRMEAHCDGAEFLAQALAVDPRIVRVFYPGLETHPGFDIARRQMSRFGAMISLDLGSATSARCFLDHLQLFTQAVSLGDVESLACHPASTTHRSLGAELLERSGVTQGLVRLSVGIEDPSDLLDDIQQALEACF